MTELLKDAFTVLAEHSPYAFIVVMVIIFAYKMYTHAVNTMKSLYDDATKNMQDINNESLKIMRNTAEFLNDLKGK